MAECRELAPHSPCRAPHCFSKHVRLAPPADIPISSAWGDLLPRLFRFPHGIGFIMRCNRQFWCSAGYHWNAAERPLVLSYLMFVVEVIKPAQGSHAMRQLLNALLERWRQT